MPKQLNNGKITEALQRAFGFKGRYIPMLDEVVVPVYQIADPIPADPAPTYASSILVAKNGLESVRIRFRNNIGSGITVQITSLSIGIFEELPGAKPVLRPVIFIEEPGTNATDFSTVAVLQNRDTRETLPSRISLTGQTFVPGVDRTIGVIARTIVNPDSTLAEVVSAPGQETRQPLVVLEEGFSVGIRNEGSAAIDLPFLANFSWLELPTDNPTQ